MATKIKIETAKGIMIAELYDETVEVVDFIRPGDSIVSMEVIK